MLQGVFSSDQTINLIVSNATVTVCGDHKLCRILNTRKMTPSEISHSIVFVGPLPVICSNSEVIHLTEI